MESSGVWKSRVRKSRGGRGRARASKHRRNNSLSPSLLPFSFLLLLFSLPVILQAVDVLAHLRGSLFGAGLEAVGKEDQGKERKNQGEIADSAPIKIHH